MTTNQQNDHENDHTYTGTQISANRDTPFSRLSKAQLLSSSSSTPSSSTMVNNGQEEPETTSLEIDATLPPVDLRLFMTTFPTGVGLITAMDANEHPWGMTCTSLCSVTLEPPTLLVCLRRGSPTLEAVLTSREFALHLLHDSACSTAELFASGAPDRFARVNWHMTTAYKGPHLLDAAHFIADCQVVHSKTAGSHIVVFGEVHQITRQSDAPPLLYGFRRYTSWPEGCRTE